MLLILEAIETGIYLGTLFLLLGNQEAAKHLFLILICLVLRRPSQKMAKT